MAMCITCIRRPGVMLSQIYLITAHNFTGKPVQHVGAALKG